jgi:hypothetical protein
MGYGADGCIAQSLEIGRWCHSILCTTKVSYVHVNDPNTVVEGPDRAGIKSYEATVRFKPFEERVKEVEIAYGAGTWQAGAVCLNRISFTMEDIATEEIRKQSVGMGGSTPHIRYITIPEGCTLAGFCGRSGDSLDQLGLYICPWIPKEWSIQNHSLCPEPFQEQVAAFKEAAASYELPARVEDAVTAALFQATFYEGAAGATEDDYISSWCRQKVEAASAAVFARDSHASDDDSYRYSTDGDTSSDGNSDNASDEDGGGD